MPGSVNISDFSAGWCPSDDAFHGRRNCLLQMDNLELDANGSLTLIGGTTTVTAGLPAAPHTMFSRIMGGSRKDYLALADGSVFRNSASIVSGGDTKNAGFGTAFNFSLIASGTQRKKDTGLGVPVNLGLTTPIAAPTAVGQQVQPVVPAFPLNAPFISIPKGIYHIDADNILRLKADADGIGIIQSYALPQTPYDWSVFDDGGIETDNDEVSLYIGSFVPQNDTLQIDFYLDTPNTTGQYDNYYSHLVNTSDLQLFYPEGAAFGAYLIQLKRNQFDRIGPSSVGWEAVQGYRITYTTPRDIGLALGLDPDATIGFVGGSHAQNGVYEYAEMFVNNTGSYLAKSELGPASAPITVKLAKTFLNLVLPTEAQVNEIWIFRRSVNGQGLLDQWYRVKVIKQNSAGFTDPTSPAPGAFVSSTNVTIPGTTNATRSTTAAPSTNPLIPSAPTTINAQVLAYAAGYYFQNGQWYGQGNVSVAGIAGDPGIGISSESWMIFKGLGFNMLAAASPSTVSGTPPTAAFLAQWPNEAAEIIRRGILAGLVPTSLL